MNYTLATSAFLGLFSFLWKAEKSDYPTQDFLWYKQPAIVKPAVLPWSDGSSMARNLPGKPNKDPWESQSLPVGNGRGWHGVRWR